MPHSSNKWSLRKEWLPWELISAKARVEEAHVLQVTYVAPATDAPLILLGDTERVDGSIRHLARARQPFGDYVTCSQHSPVRHYHHSFTFTEPSSSRKSGIPSAPLCSQDAAESANITPEGFHDMCLWLNPTRQVSFLSTISVWFERYSINLECHYSWKHKPRIQLRLECSSSAWNFIRYNLEISGH